MCTPASVETRDQSDRPWFTRLKTLLFYAILAFIKVCSQMKRSPYNLPNLASSIFEWAPLQDEGGGRRGFYWQRLLPNCVPPPNMPARGSACRAARTKTAERICESLISPHPPNPPAPRRKRALARLAIATFDEIRAARFPRSRLNPLAHFRYIRFITS